MKEDFDDTTHKAKSIIMRDKIIEKKALRRRCRENFKTLDQFGQTLNLTWNGED